MKKTIAYLICVTLLTGCVKVSGTKTANGDLKISSHRFVWASEGIDFSVKDDKGFTTSLKVAKSKPDSDVTGVVTEAAIKAALTYFNAPKLPNTNQ